MINLKVDINIIFHFLFIDEESDNEPAKYAQLNESEAPVIIDTNEKDLSYIQSGKEWEDLKLSISLNNINYF